MVWCGGQERSKVGGSGLGWPQTVGGGAIAHIALKDLPTVLRAAQPVDHRLVHPNAGKIVRTLHNLASCEHRRGFRWSIADQQVMVANDDTVLIRIDDMIGGVTTDTRNDVGVDFVEEAPHLISAADCAVPVINHP